MEEDIIEKLADNEHNRWANWQKYVHSKCIKNEDGSLTIPKEYVEHWEYEINTKYKDLPENIKESDRKEVTQVLKILDYENLIARNKELEEKNKKVMKFCKIKSTFQTFGDEEMQYVLETYINRLKHRIIDILEE